MDISLITINYNSSRHTLELIKSIASYIPHKKILIEVIIVDNGSCETEKQKLKSAQIPQWAKIIYSSENTGFAGGNHTGFEASTGDFLFFLNNDCLLIQDSFSMFVDAMENYPECGVGSGQMLEEDQKKINSFHYDPSLLIEFLGKRLGLFILGKSYISRTKSFTTPIEVDVVTGSCLFMKRKVYQEIAGLDTKFFLYCEEEDLCLRVRQTGKKVMFFPSIFIVHKCRGSSSREFDFVQEYFISFFYYLKKHRNKIEQFIWRAYLSLKYLVKKDESMRKLSLFIWQGADESKSLRYK